MKLGQGADVTELTRQKLWPQQNAIREITQISLLEQREEREEEWGVTLTVKRSGTTDPFWILDTSHLHPQHENHEALHNIRYAGEDRNEDRKTGRQEERKLPLDCMFYRFSGFVFAPFVYLTITL
jgi:hypothetical protein